MYILKGFSVIDVLSNPTPDITSRLGEISTWSLTYSKDPTEYYNTGIAGYRLICLKSYNTENDLRVVVPNTVVTQVLNMVQTCYNFCYEHIEPYDPLVLLQTLKTEFQGVASNVTMGPIVVADTISMPQWISWENSLSGDWTIKIWLADEALQEQYDEYDITVIPPIANNIDAFFGTTENIKVMMSNFSFSGFMDRIQIEKQKRPESYTRVLTYNFIPPEINELPIQTNWGLLVYGVLGDNQDAMRQAIIDYTIQNSIHTIDEWAVKIPDLFKRTEFVIVPRWDLYAIENLSIQAGLYSCAVDPVDCLSFVKAKINFYTDAHIHNNLTIAPHFHKYLALCIVNGPDNQTGKAKFKDLFKDYTFAPTDSLDHNRMTVYTREWINILTNMLVVAENMDALTTVPTYMRKVRRNNKLYVSAIYDNVNYLVYAKNNP